MSPARPPQAFNLRPARDSAADAAAITALQNEMIRTTDAIYLDAPLLEAEVRDWLRGRLSAGLPVMLAEAGAGETGEAAGFGSYGPFRPRWGYRRTVEHSVHVSRRFQGRGIGAAVLEHLIAVARETGVHVMIAGVDGANAGSVRFHQRFGFEEAGLIREAAAKGGRWLDLRLLALRLSEGPPPGPSEP